MRARIRFPLIFLISFFILFFSWFTMHMFNLGMWCGYDQGTYDQSLWTTLHGRLLWCSFTGLDGLCDLAVHMHLTTLLLVPVYAIFPLPMTLSIFQVIILGLSAVFIYRIAEEKMNSAMAFFFSVFYLTNNFTVQAVIEGFQARTFSMVFSLAAFYFLSRKKYLLSVLFIALLVFSHGVNALIAAMFGLYIAFVHRKGILGISVTLLAIAWFLISINILQPRLGLAEPLGPLQFSPVGAPATATGIMQYFLQYPLEILGRLFTRHKLDYLVRLLAPLGFLSLLSPKELLIGLPVFLQNLFFSESFIQVQVPRYTMPLLPFIFISAIYSAARLFKKGRLRWKIAQAALLFLWAASGYAFIWNPGYNPRFLQILSPVTPEVRIHRDALRKIAALVPQDAAVCADLKAFPFLANRFGLYDLPWHLERCEYVLIDKKEPTFSVKPTLLQEQYRKIVEGVLNSSQYTVVKEEDQVILLRKRM